MFTYLAPSILKEGARTMSTLFSENILEEF